MNKESCVYVSFSDLGRLGRLGNQMFQYAALYALADKLNCNMVINFDNENVSPISGVPAYHILNIHELFDLSIGRENNITTFRQKNSDCIENKSIELYGKVMSGSWRENTHHYDPTFFTDVHPYMDILGFYQDEKYFVHIKDKIKKEFTFKKEVMDRAKEVTNQALRENSKYDRLAALHVRRTDFINSMPAPSLDYYIEAISQLDPEYKFIVCSDDVKWCKETFEFMGDRFYFSEENHFVDLCMMSLCDHHIIANSSFSWWSAWLSENENKKVFYPKSWWAENQEHSHRNGDGEHSMCPSEWTCLES
tara:strand:+ start:1092 stop:2012 length:921 start_codon:yes stop_codon:yes gene_type:complete